MLRYVIKRLLMMIPVLLGVLIIVFILTAISPGNPVDSLIGADAPQAAKDALAEELGLNDPIYIRFFNYVKNLILHGDLGKSYTTKQPVMGELLSRWPTTFFLAIGSIIVALLIGIPLGVLSAVKQYSWIDNTAMVIALAAVSMPQFWLGLMLMLLFAVKLGVLPTSGITDPLGWILPIVTCGFCSAANIARTTRSSMLEVIRADYIRTTRAKGQKEFTIVTKHALRNALIPIVTTVGSQVGVMLGGSIAIESVFGLPGLGSYMVEAMTSRNYPAIQGAVLLVAVTFSLVNLIVDLSYGFIDPRIMATYQKKKKIHKSQEAVSAES